jgi:hypothetical protein
LNEERNAMIPSKLITADTIRQVLDGFQHDLNKRDIYGGSIVQSDISALNAYIRQQYMLDEDIVTLVETRTGYKYNIDEKLLNETNNDINDFATRSFTDAEIINQMSEVVAFGYSPMNDITNDPAVNPTNRFERVIRYKESLAKRLERQLLAVEANKLGMPISSPDYSKLIKAENEIRMRLNGKTIHDTGEEIKGLYQEIKDLKKEDSVIAIESYIQNDLQRLSILMSRNDIEAGHISLHPAGIPHGPHPGAVERSIGKTETQELAVMVDTFKPLMVTEEAMKIADDKYYLSWLDQI